ncbi:MAG: DNA repair protein RecO [Anaerolineae bacterium]|nr:DNA repair protein RecO [Anaerolineae bacterium]
MSRERTFRTEAIVLRRTDFGEADRLLTLYCREFGKLRAVAKGARKPQSRKTGHVELFMRTQFLLAEGRDLPIITQAEMVQAYRALREDLVRTTYAAYGVELLDQFTPDEERNSRLYDLLAAALSWFATTHNILGAARYYELRLLTLVGFQPQLFHCVRCETPVAEQDQFFSAELGGILCPNCQPFDRKAKPISAAAVKVLRHLQTRDWKTAQALNLKRSLHTELETIMHFYLRYHLERQLKSVDFLHRLRQEAALFAAAPEPDEGQPTED